VNNFYLLIWHGGYEPMSITAAPTFTNAQKVFGEWAANADPTEDEIDVYYLYKEGLTGAILLEQLSSYENDSGWHLNAIDESKFV